MVGESDPAPKPKQLSQKAMAILLLASEGKADKIIAGELGLTRSAIDYHWRKIRKSLGAADRTQAVVRGLDLAYHDRYARAARELAKAKRLEHELRLVNERVAVQRSHEQRFYGEWLENQYSKYQDPRGWTLRMHSLRWQTETGSAFFFRAENFLPIRFLFFDGVEQFGYRAEDFWTGEKTLLDFVHEGDREFIHSHYAPMSDLDGPMIEFQYRAMTTSGEVRWFYARVVFEKDELGTASYCSGIGFDVTHNVDEGRFAPRAWARYGGKTYENA